MQAHQDCIKWPAGKSGLRRPSSLPDSSGRGNAGRVYPAAPNYWLTNSPFLEPFTAKPKTAEDLKPEAERIKIKKCDLCPPPDHTPVPPDLGPGGLIYGIGELMRLHQPDLCSLFTTTTGGRTLSFLKKRALEQAIQLVGEEVHRQYILSIEPKGGEPGKFHAVRVEVKNRPEFPAKTRGILGVALTERLVEWQHTSFCRESTPNI